MKTYEIHPTFFEAEVAEPGEDQEQKLFESFKYFLENHPPSRLSRDLRNVLLTFLQQEGATEALFLQNFLFDVSALFDLLEEATKLRPETTESISQSD